jgi:hypothetical protein
MNIYMYVCECAWRPPKASIRIYVISMPPKKKKYIYIYICWCDHVNSVRHSMESPRSVGMYDRHGVMTGNQMCVRVNMCTCNMRVFLSVKMRVPSSWRCVRLQRCKLMHTCADTRPKCRNLSTCRPAHIDQDCPSAGRNTIQALTKSQGN